MATDEKTGTPPALRPVQSRFSSLREVLDLLDGDLWVSENDRDAPGAPTLRLRRLSPNLVDEVRQTFVFPPDWDKRRTEFSKQNVVILRGEAGSGRSATAVRLLQALSVEQFYQLDATVDLELFALFVNRLADTGTVHPQSGYLLNRPSSQGVLSAETFGKLAAALEPAMARLVVTVDDDVQLSDDVMLQFVIDVPPPPPPRDVFREHLRWRLGEGAASRLLDQPAVTELAEEVLTASPGLGRAAALALAMAPEPDGSVDLHRIRERAKRRSDDEFDIWFDSLTDMDDRTFAIALATLNGLPFDAVARAAAALRVVIEHSLHRNGRILDPAPHLDYNPMDLFRATNDRRLTLLRAHMVSEITEAGSFGGIPIEVIRYRNPEYTRRVIERAWESGPIRGALLAWLEALVDDGPDRVRMFAATTVGLLMRSSSEQLVRTKLLPWAGDGDRGRRDGVAYALRVVAGDPQWRSYVESLAAAWYKDTAVPAVQATAARVYGISLGEAAPLRAMRPLERLAMVADPRVTEAVAETVTDLVSAHPGLAPEVLRNVVAWLEHRKRAMTGYRVFLALADAVVADVPGIGDRGWPMLLDQARRERSLREPLAMLWHRALNDPVVHVEAERVLTRWATFADNDHEVLDAFVRLMRATAQLGSRTMRILRSLAYRWDSDEEMQPLIATAAAVLAVVDLREEVA